MAWPNIVGSFFKSIIFICPVNDIINIQMVCGRNKGSNSWFKIPCYEWKWKAFHRIKIISCCFFGLCTLYHTSISSAAKFSKYSNNSMKKREKIYSYIHIIYKLPFFICLKLNILNILQLHLIKILMMYNFVFKMT